MKRAILFAAVVLIVAAAVWAQGQRSIPAALSEASASCIECHEADMPGLVKEWWHSRHYAADVGCYECHAAAEGDLDAVEHNGYNIAVIVSGDARIAQMLARDGTVVIPAYACRFDGFVNDTFTEYANPSIYRPASVCRARLVSTVQDVVRASGGYYLGFTMYTTAGHDEPAKRPAAPQSLPAPVRRPGVVRARRGAPPWCWACGNAAPPAPIR